MVSAWYMWFKKTPIASEIRKKERAKKKLQMEQEIVVANKTASLVEQLRTLGTSTTYFQDGPNGPVRRVGTRTLVPTSKKDFESFNSVRIRRSIEPDQLTDRQVRASRRVCHTTGTAVGTDGEGCAISLRDGGGVFFA